MEQSGRHDFVVLVARPPSAAQRAGLAGGVRVGYAETDLHVQRFGGDLGEAVIGAVNDLAALGLRPVRVIDDELVTLAEIASRIGRSRESVRQWAAGLVGPGGFPQPLNPRHACRCYSWTEVSHWLRAHRGDLLRKGDPEPVLLAVNLVLQLRDIVTRIRRPALIFSLLPDALRQDES